MAFKREDLRSRSTVRTPERWFQPAWYRRDKRVSAVMIEINRRLYMDETTGQKNAGFAETRATVQSVVTGLVASTA